MTTTAAVSFPTPQIGERAPRSLQLEWLGEVMLGQTAASVLRNAKVVGPPRSTERGGTEIDYNLDGAGNGQKVQLTKSTNPFSNGIAYRSVGAKVPFGLYAAIDRNDDGVITGETVSSISITQGKVRRSIGIRSPDTSNPNACRSTTVSVVNDAGPNEKSTVGADRNCDGFIDLTYGFKRQSGMSGYALDRDFNGTVDEKKDTGRPPPDVTW